MTPSVAKAESPQSPAAARIDLACVVDKQLLVYGWALNFSTCLRSAVIHFGDADVDLGTQAITVRRVDVTRHFPTQARNDEHGFYSLIDLPFGAEAVNQLRLSIDLRSGEATETQWPVLHGDAAISELQDKTSTLKTLLRQLPRSDAARLRDFAADALPLAVRSESPGALPPPVQFEIDLCSVIENRILVVAGWVFDPVNELTVAQVSFGASTFDLLGSSLRVSRPDLTELSEQRAGPELAGFILVEALTARDTEDREAGFEAAAGDATLRFRRPVCRIAAEARGELLSLLSRMEPDSALALIERLSEELGDLPAERSLRALLDLHRGQAIAHLPVSIQHEKPEYSLHIDKAIPIAEEGLFLTGWFYAEPAASVRVLCRSGDAGFIVSDVWVRHARPDVSASLAGRGLPAPAEEPGFCCYVPLRSGDSPAYLSVESGSGEKHGLKLGMAKRAGSALDCVRSVLASLNDGRRLRILLDNHVGPAVSAAWAAREKPSRQPAIRAYGPAPAMPAVSVIVPLYGRHDLVEYQMALFADDPDVGSAELMYVVDDPAIYDEFRNACPGIFGVYQVPFVTVFAGANLGFAGANNLGAGKARAPFLLLMNSDVVPRRPGWLGRILADYQSLERPGLLGAKLLYEDGSIQHAGMAFRRHAEWEDLWVNDHPLKGLSPLGLHGVRPARAVTAACALIETALYRDLGGFSEDYIIGDFEDSDLCLRASAAGRQNYVDLDVELYHLERQSQDRVGDALWRRNLTLYNCWLQNRRWADSMEHDQQERARPE